MVFESIKNRELNRNLTRNLTRCGRNQACNQQNPKQEHRSGSNVQLPEGRQSLPESLKD